MKAYFRCRWHTRGMYRCLKSAQVARIERKRFFLPQLLERMADGDGGFRSESFSAQPIFLFSWN